MIQLAIVRFSYTCRHWWAGASKSLLAPLVAQQQIYTVQLPTQLRQGGQLNSVCTAIIQLAYAEWQLHPVENTAQFPSFSFSQRLKWGA